jgi:hypothetical protein
MVSQSRIQEAYQSHRTARNTVQKAQFLSPTFQKLSVDPILFGLENPQLHPGYQDPRHCLVLWARPPDHVLRLAAEIQGRLKGVAPSTCETLLDYRMNTYVMGSRPYDSF